MPAFLELEFWKFDNPELWVAVGLILFLAILWFAGAFKMAMGALDSKASAIQQDLDEAARLRAEAEAMLARLKAEGEQTEKLAAEILANAIEDAKQMEIDSKAKLEEQIRRRAEMAERRIANAEAQAAVEVRAAAADLAAQMAETVLAARLAVAQSDPLVDAAMAQLGATKLN
jgi:F-type H+-transporting ATPase subunit b